MWRAIRFAIAFAFVASVASAQQPCTTDARKVVDELYRHMLERGADAGSQHWVTQLQNGQMTVRDLVREIAKSPEHNQRFVKQETGEETPYVRSVNRLYRHILGRQPDAAGARSHAETVARQGINSVIDALVSSDEYNQRYGDWGVPGSGGIVYCGANNQGASASVTQSPNANMRFRGMDVNNDGTITQDEWRGSRQSFRVHDWNSDGVLSGDEVANAGIRSGRTIDDENFDRDDRFEYLDANNNNRIELREWHASDYSFHQLDRNGDNYLSRAEFSGDNAVATSGSSDLIYVDADQPWTDTGIDVQAGQTVVVNAQGSMQLSTDGNDTASPGGSATGRRANQAPVRQAPAGGLIAKIGNGSAMYVGARGSMRATSSGRLYLGVNDDYLADNTGEYRVNVTIRGR